MEVKLQIMTRGQKTLTCCFVFGREKKKLKQDVLPLGNAFIDDVHKAWGK